METFETDGIIDALATLAQKIQTLTESIESAKFIPAVRKEQRQFDMKAIESTMYQAIHGLEVRATAELPKEAKEALNDFNQNLKTFKRRPLFDGRKSRRLFIGALLFSLIGLSGLLYAVYETTWSKDAYAKRAYYVSVELGIDEPEKAYDFVQKKWSKQKKLVKAKVKSFEYESREKPDDSK
jgi:hypothetical protein